MYLQLGSDKSMGHLQYCSDGDHPFRIGGGDKPGIRAPSLASGQKDASYWMYPKIIDSLTSFFRIKALSSRLFGGRFQHLFPSPVPVAEINEVKPVCSKPTSQLKAAIKCFGPKFRDLQSSPVTRQYIGFPTNILQTRLIAHQLSFCSPLSFVEAACMKNSLILPSIMRALKPKEEGKVQSEKQPHSAMIVRNLCNGEFSGASPREFIDKLDNFQADLNERIESLKGFCRRLYQENVPCSFAFVDGKMAIRTENEQIMASVVFPALRNYASWNDSWNISALLGGNRSSDSISDLRPLASSVSFDNPQAPESVYEDAFSELTIRDILPSATEEEIEVFSAWSRA